MTAAWGYGVPFSGSCCHWAVSRTAQTSQVVLGRVRPRAEGSGSQAASGRPLLRVCRQCPPSLPSQLLTSGNSCCMNTRKGSTQAPSSLGTQPRTPSFSTVSPAQAGPPLMVLSWPPGEPTGVPKNKNPPSKGPDPPGPLSVPKKHTLLPSSLQEHPWGRWWRNTVT